ncbi:MAG: sugar MFS transporter [Bacteroidales bacterium]|jgi:glucose/galactose transporter|nr:sugar MFS transporter [Bacteroidales bacterium]
MDITNAKSRKGSYVFSLIIIGILFFIFGFVTWLNGALIPFLKTACELNDITAYFVTFAFYISYFVMAIPSSKILEKIGFRKGMAVGLAIMAVGAVIFIPAAFARSYALFLTGLFVLGTGLALLQTAVNPYITILGPIESAAKRISIMGICNKFAGVLAPVLLASILLKDAEAIKLNLANMTNFTEKAAVLDALAERMVLPYLLMASFLAALAVMIRFAKLPEINPEKSDINQPEGYNKKNGILKYPHLFLGVIALFFYVGVEVIAGDTIIRYGESLGVAMSSAKYFTSLVLIFMVIGYFFGVLLIPRVISQKNALAVCAVLGIVLSLAAIYVSSFRMFSIPFVDLLTFEIIRIQIPYTVLFVAMLGLANSLVWPAIWPLALDGIGNYTKIGSAFLIMAIAGGATLPLVYGWLAHLFNSTQQAYWITVPCYIIIFYYAVAGHKVKSRKII